jgi:beta-lactamase class A
MAARHASRRQRHRRWITKSALLALVLGVGYAVLAAGGPATARSISRVPARRSGTGLSPDLRQQAAPTSTTNPDEVTGLFSTAMIEDYLQAQHSDINAAVYDLHTGQLSLYRPGALEYTASIVKVDILATLLRQADQAGTALSAEDKDLATTMIENSDDDAATQLWDDIGQQTGLAGFDSLLPIPATFPGTDGHWGGTTTSGADQVRLLRELVQPSRLLNQSAQSYELGLMENVESNQAWGVSAGIPAGVTVALKDGWLSLEDNGDWQVNSIGWVDGDGRDYLISVLTKNNDTEGAGIATIEGLSPLVWSALTPGRS